MKKVESTTKIGMLSCSTLLCVHQESLAQVFSSRRFGACNAVSHYLGKKFDPKWDGLYVVMEVYSNGAYLLITLEGLRLGPINGKFLKRYYY